MGSCRQKKERSIKRFVGFYTWAWQQTISPRSAPFCVKDTKVNGEPKPTITSARIFIVIKTKLAKL